MAPSRKVAAADGTVCSDCIFGKPDIEVLRNVPGDERVAFSTAINRTARKMISAVSAQPTFSIVVPMKNEADNVALLVSEIEAACAGHAFEAIFIDDGSTDRTRSVLTAAQRAHPWVRVVRHENSGGQTAAVHSGVLLARSPVICTMDGDGQNPPSEIPRLVAPLIGSAVPARLGLVAGQRQKREDTASKRLASLAANWIRSRLLNDGTRDTGCGLKAFRRDAFLELPYFNHMHRYLPALFSAYGWQVLHIDVSHRQRNAGQSNYNNLQRALVGITDLMGVVWLIKRKKPVRPQEESVPS